MNIVGNVTEKRKREHIETVLNSDVSAKGITTGFDRYFFDHIAVPEINLSEINLSSTLFGRELVAPILISSMTGGTDTAHEINKNLASAAQSCGIAMGLGSQRAAIEDETLIYSYKVRSVAPDILLFANIGAVQLNYGYNSDHALRAVDMIEADALYLHLNSLQEAVQEEGDTDWRGLYNKIEKLVREVQVPVIVKEVGNGISADVAKRLAYCGVSGIDVAGAGGTSWSEVEAYRQTNNLQRRIAHTFSGWGIPTALALDEVHAAVPDIPVFASGGLRSGIDVAKALRLGASLCGVATPTLGDASKNAKAVHEGLTAIIEELRITAFCTGARDLRAFKTARLRLHKDWSVVGVNSKENGNL